MTRKEKLLFGLDMINLRGIEIGPLDRPIVGRNESRVLYVDYMTTEELRAHYAGDPGVRCDHIEPVDVVHDKRLGTGTLAEVIGGVVDRDNAAADTMTAITVLDKIRADYVVASHVIEHVPDLIGWLTQIEAVLKPAGALRLAIPDRQYTFDYLRWETCVADVIAAWVGEDSVPSPRAVMDHFLNTRPIDRLAAWAKDVKVDISFKPEMFYTALALAERAHKGEYIDVHTWVFTPDSFIELMRLLCELGLVHYECTGFHMTEVNDIEFFVWMRPCRETSRCARSWGKDISIFRHKG